MRSFSRFSGLVAGGCVLAGAGRGLWWLLLQRCAAGESSGGADHLCRQWRWNDHSANWNRVPGALAKLFLAATDWVPAEERWRHRYRLQHSFAETAECHESGPSRTLADRISTPADEDNWNRLNQLSYLSIQSAQSLFGQWDGFWDATRAAVSLPAGVSRLVSAATRRTSRLANISRNWTSSWSNRSSAFSGWCSRIRRSRGSTPRSRQTRWRSMRCSGSTGLCPSWAINTRPSAWSPAVPACTRGMRLGTSNCRTGKRSGVAEGSGPGTSAALPPNRVLTRASESGAGKVVEDNSAEITSELSRLNAGKAAPADAGGGCADASRSSPHGLAQRGLAARRDDLAPAPHAASFVKRATRRAGTWLAR